MLTHRTTESKAERELKRISCLYTETGELFKTTIDLQQKSLSLFSVYRNKRIWASSRNFHRNSTS